MDKKEVVVVVPVYRPELTVWERASLRQTVGVLQENYPVELLVPCGMDCSAIRREFSGLPVREVSDEWLGRKNGIAGYNRMMLSAGFYELFRDYEYLLICHTDAWIFRDELADWCRRGYDCVAAPWVRRKVYDLPILKQYLRWRLRRAERAGRMIRQSLYREDRKRRSFASPRGEFSGRVRKIRRRDRAVLFDGQPPGQRGCFLGRRSRRVSLSFAGGGAAVRVRHQSPLLLPFVRQSPADGVP